VRASVVLCGEQLPARERWRWRAAPLACDRCARELAGEVAWWRAAEREVCVGHELVAPDGTRQVLTATVLVRPLDPVTGLTAAQLGPECLDCGGGGTCDPLTWTLRDEDGNLLEQGSVTDPCGDALPLTAPNASVLRDGAAYGTVLSGGSIDVPSDCPCDPLTVTVNDTIEYATVDEPCGATTNVEVVNEADEQVGTLVTGKIVVPTAKSLCELVTEGTSEEVAICVISSGKRPGVLAEIIPTVPEGDTVAQVYDVMTPAQQDLFDVTVQLQDSAASPIGAPDVYAAGTTANKTAPDGTVTVVDHLGDTIGSTTVKSNGTAQVLVTDWEGEYPVLTENTPTYNDEGDSTIGWTLSGGTMASASSVVRLTQTTGGTQAFAERAVTMPLTNKDWVLYSKIKARRTASDNQAIDIRTAGLDRFLVFLNFNSVTNLVTTGTISIRSVNAAGTTTNVVVATGVLTDSVWTEMAMLYSDKFDSFSVYLRQTDGSWKFGAQTNGTFFGTTLRITANGSTAGSWTEFDYITLVSPNIQSIGDSITSGSTLFSPVVASALTNADSTWQRWAPLYTSLRNNLIVNKGVGGNTIGQVEARIQADVLDNLPALVLLSACANDYGAGTSQADKTTNTQDCIDLCATAGVPVILHNSTYTAAALAGNHARRDYYKEWWDDYRPTLTGLEGTIDIMGGLKDPAGYADALLTQSDNVHPNVVGYGRMGQWIAALPYA